MALAQVSLPTVNLGDTNFEDGIAGAGGLAEELPGYYTASERKEPNARLEASLRFHYLWNSANDRPFIGLGFKDIQAGQAFYANYATSYAVRKGIRLGFNGYWLKQITDHRINGKDVPNSRESTIGLGPGLQLGGQGLWFRVNSYFETGVQNRMSGIKVTFRVSKTF